MTTGITVGSSGSCVPQGFGLFLKFLDVKAWLERDPMGMHLFDRVT
jgi:hypothetical protein